MRDICYQIIVLTFALQTGQSRPSDLEVIERARAAVSRIQSYDVVLVITEDFDLPWPKDAPPPDKRTLQRLDYIKHHRHQIRDVFTPSEGRLIEMLDRNGSKISTMWRDDRDQRINSGSPKSARGVAPGRDYMSCFNPMINNRNIFERLRAEREAGRLRITWLDGVARLEIPAEMLDPSSDGSPIKEYGFRVLIDSAKGFMPTGYDIYYNLDRKETTVVEARMELSHVARNVWAPISGKVILQSLPGMKAMSKQREIALAVDMTKSSWNSNGGAVAFPDATNQADDIHDGWKISTRQIRAVGQDDRAIGRWSAWLIGLNVLFVLILLILIAKRRGRMRLG